MRRGQPRVWLPSFLYRDGVGCFRGRLAEFFVVGGMFCVRLAGVADFVSGLWRVIMSVLFCGVVFYLLI